MNLGASIRRSYRKLRSKKRNGEQNSYDLLKEVQKLKMLEAKLLTRQIAAQGVLPGISSAEFSVYSQFGEDGIIQYLLEHVKNLPESFIEFGVETYTEASTRYLLENNNWRGLILDCDCQAMEALRSQSIFWRHDLTAVGAFIDCDNVNRLFSDHGFTGKIGLLSIDIDGNDYWVWDSIKVVDPTIVVVEYNSVFGPSIPVTVPYDPGFSRAKAHYSMLYWGCSLGALCLLAQKKGYSLVGCDSAGVNSFFVRNDSLGQLQALSPEAAYVPSRLRQSRDEKGRLSFLNFQESQRLIGDSPVCNVTSGQIVPLADLL
jgi:hypothetical protein